MFPMSRIRAATAVDAGAIAAVHVACWRESYPGLVADRILSGLSIEKRAASWLRILNDPSANHDTAVYVAADRDGSILGFGACSGQRTHDLADGGFAGEFQSIYVLRQAQRRRLGAALMAAMAQDLESRGLVGAALWVLRGNTPARGFYEAVGGGIVGERDERRDGQVLPEVAYGWRRLPPLYGGR